MNKHKLLLGAGIIFVLCVIGLLVFLLVPRSSEESTDQEVVEQQPAATTFKEDIQAQTADVDSLFKNGELEYSDENSNDYMFLLSLYEDASDFENAIKLADAIPNTADILNVHKKYTSLMQSTQISMKFADYEKYRAEYLEYLAANPEQTIENLETFEDRYPLRNQVEKQFEEGSEIDEDSV